MSTVISMQEEEYSERFDLGVWKKLLAYTIPYRRHLLLMFVVAVLLAGTEAAFTLMTRYVIDAVTAGDKASLPVLAGVYFALTLLFCLEVASFIRLAGRISTGISYDVRQAGFDHLQDLSFSFYDRRPTGWLMARLTSDCDSLSRTIAWGSMDLVWGACMVVGVSAIMLVLNWKLGLLVLTVVPPMAWVSLVFQKRILHASRAVRKQNSNITAAYNECITGVRTTKTLVREDENLREFEDLTTGMFSDSVRRAVLSAVYFPIMMAMAGIAVGLSLWVGGNYATTARWTQGDFTIGTLVLFVSCAGMLIFPILEMARVFAELQNTQAAAERVLGLIGTEPDVKDSPVVTASIEANRGGQTADIAIDGRPERISRIRFNNVCFAYREDRQVLKNFDLTVDAGQTIALVGLTGGGKSTVVSLLCRFYEPVEGQILFDGIEYRQRSLEWLQSNLGIVLQDAHLFSGTIRENIRYGRLNASDEEVVEAAKLVRAHDFIATLPDAYDTEVGEGGGKLSTGQKQLVSFARAVLADPQIFVMDEATSSVDTQTEQLIQQGLQSVLRGRISFIIAHRLSTIRSADMILVIDDGRIVEQGSHGELIGRRGQYYELYTNQFAQEKTSEMLSQSDE